MDASDRDRWEFLREASEDLCAPASKLDFELNGNACAPAQALWSLRLRTPATRFRQLDSELERAQLMSAFTAMSIDLLRNRLKLLTSLSSKVDVARYDHQAPESPRELPFAYKNLKILNLDCNHRDVTKTS